ncbi:hypothetical protein AGMMS49921_07140 [Endomicrobiia bacterium]|nr:hypothetical protein AGMMS49921_07140 [Endomicrobiia bacterium]
MVVEGFGNTISAYELGKKLKIELPIVNEIYAVLSEGKKPLKAVNDFMTRGSKHE